MLNTFSRKFSYLDIRAWPYVEVTEPTIMPIDITDLKSHVRIDYDSGTEATYLNSMIRAAVKFAEKRMNRSLITRTWRTYRDEFDTIIELRKLPIKAITMFKYYDSSGTQISLPVPPISTMYYVVDQIYPQLRLFEGQAWPTDVQNRQQNILIEFTAGYGAAKTDVPEDIRIAIMQTAAFLYANRGDSDGKEESHLMAAAMRTYDSYRPLTLTGRTYYSP